MKRGEKTDLLRRLRADAGRISRQFGLSFKEILADSPRARSRYGLCYSDGVIKIRLNHVKTGQPLKYSSLVATLCHELAHLQHFDHSPSFHKFYLRLLAWARQQRIYSPGRPPREDWSKVQPRTRVVIPGYDGPLRRDGVPVFAPPQRTPVKRPPLPWELEEARCKAPPPAPWIPAAGGRLLAPGSDRRPATGGRTPASGGRPGVSGAPLQGSLSPPRDSAGLQLPLKSRQGPAASGQLRQRAAAARARPRPPQTLSLFPAPEPPVAPPPPPRRPPPRRPDAAPCPAAQQLKLFEE